MTAAVSSVFTFSNVTIACSSCHSLSLSPSLQSCGTTDLLTDWKSRLGARVSESGCASALRLLPCNRQPGKRGEEGPTSYFSQEDCITHAAADSCSQKN